MIKRYINTYYYCYYYFSVLPDPKSEDNDIADISSDATIIYSHPSKATTVLLEEDEDMSSDGNNSQLKRSRVTSSSGEVSRPNEKKRHQDS